MSCQEETPVATVSNGQEAIQVFRDEIEDSPRKWDNMGVISMNSQSEFSGLGEETFDAHADPYELDEPGKCGAELFDGAVAVLPLFIDDWGWKRVIRTAHDDENEPPAGYIYATAEKALAMECTTKSGRPSAKKAERMLRDEIAAYNQYLADEVYEARLVRTEKCDKGHEHENILDSLHGYYPEYDGNIDEDGRCTYAEPYFQPRVSPVDEVVKRYIEYDLGADGRGGWYAAAAACADLSPEAREYWAGLAAKAAGPGAGAGGADGGGGGGSGP